MDMHEIYLPNIEIVRWPNVCFLCGAPDPGKVHRIPVSGRVDVGVPVCAKDHRRLTLADRVFRWLTLLFVVLFVALGIGSFWIEMPYVAHFVVWVAGALIFLVLETILGMIITNTMAGAEEEYGLPVVTFEKKQHRYRFEFCSEAMAESMRRINIERTEIGFSTEKGFPEMDINLGMPLGGHTRIADGAVEIGRIPYPLALNFSQFYELAASRRFCALPIDNLKFAETVRKVSECFSADPQLDSSFSKAAFAARLVCLGCRLETPALAKAGLMQGLAQTAGVADSAIGYGEFGSLGKCPRCGSTRSYYIYDNPSVADITREDLDAIRSFERHLAGKWWREQLSGDASCELCKVTLTRDEGCLHGGKMYCERCVSTFFDESALEKLRGNPDYFGNGILTQARHYARAKPDVG
jgi:hypothetical protein